jgi:hypothetical protein
MTIIAGMAGLCQVVVAYEPPAKTMGTTHNRHNWIRAAHECERECVRNSSAKVLETNGYGYQSMGGGARGRTRQGRKAPRHPRPL